MSPVSFPMGIIASMLKGRIEVQTLREELLPSRMSAQEELSSRMFFFEDSLCYLQSCSVDVDLSEYCSVDVEAVENG